MIINFIKFPQLSPFTPLKTKLVPSKKINTLGISLLIKYFY